MIFRTSGEILLTFKTGEKSEKNTLKTNRRLIIRGEEITKNPA